MDVFISSIGTAVPRYKQHQQKTAEMITAALQLEPAKARLLKAIYKATAIEFRYSVLSDFCKSGDYDFFPNDFNLPFPSTAKRMEQYKLHALSLALQAVEDCIENAENFSAKNITHVITVSCTGMYAPGLDIELVQHLQLNSNVKRTTVNFMGCYGAFNALKLADAICKADRNACVLAVCVELCTLHFQKNDSLENIFSNAIFADGAAAVLIQAKQPSKFFKLDAFHCDLLMQNSEDMTWHIGDNGFDIVLSSYVPQAIESGIGIFLNKFLYEQQMQISDIDLFAIHPGGYKILKACEQALSITEEDNSYSYAVLKQYGNMSSATVLFVLKSIWNELEQHKNKRIFSCAFGPGLTLEAMMLRS